MCIFDEKLYACGCPRRCNFLPCKEYEQASINNRGGYFCSKRGEADKLKVLKSFCDNKACEERDNDLAGKKKSLKRNNDTPARTRNKMAIAREAFRKEREEAEEIKLIERAMEEQRAKARADQGMGKVAKAAAIRAKNEWKAEQKMATDVAEMITEEKTEAEIDRLEKFWEGRRAKIYKWMENIPRPRT